MPRLGTQHWNLLPPNLGALSLRVVWFAEEREKFFAVLDEEVEEVGIEHVGAEVEAFVVADVASEAAKVIGLEVPKTLLARAEVIE
jgi:hypothetical protein